MITGVGYHLSAFSSSFTSPSSSSSFISSALMCCYDTSCNSKRPFRLRHIFSANGMDGMGSFMSALSTYIYARRITKGLTGTKTHVGILEEILCPFFVNRDTQLRIDGFLYFIILHNGIH